MTEKAPPTETAVGDEAILHETMQLSLTLLLNDLNYSKYMLLPVEHRLGLAGSAGITPPQLVRATEQIGRIVRARNAELLLRAVSGTH